MATTPHTSGGEHHITPPIVFVKVLLALFVLMAITVAASYVSLPNIGPIPGVWLNNLLALGIAVTKALLVIMFFMGVKYSTPLTKLWVIAGFITFGGMFFILADNFTRVYEPAPSWVEGWEGSAAPRVLNPLNETPPDEINLNVRPRQ